MNTIKMIQNFYGIKLTFKDFVMKNFILYDWFLKKDSSNPGDGLPNRG